jgi:D-lactate dehydrogenase
MTPAVLEARAAARRAQFEPTEIGQLLSGILPQSQILTREIDRIMFASDASFYRLIPKAVVQPKTVDEVKALFEFSHKHGVPLTFRAGGTSLSGQAITDGILVDVGRYWRGARVLDNGKAIWVQPGLIGQQANNSLQLYRAKIGPDPASIAACRMGGILANNASGMCCGVVQNAYHTLRSTRFVLPSGTEIDTAQPDADEVFRSREPALTQGLLRLKQEIELNRGLYERIRAKYRMKNTTGYGLNAFIDFDRPAEIFSHLLIGSEGTLAFIAEAVLDTVPDFPVKYTGLLLFPNLHAACAAIVPLRDAGAAALELMDRASLRSVDNHPGVPPYIKELPDGAAGLLAEFQTPDESGRAENEKRAQAALQGLEFLHEPLFTSNPAEQADLWHLRKSMFPSVGAARATGTTVIIEDVAFPVEKLAGAAVDLRRLLDEHGYAAAIIFGHAKDGNLHFVITQSFNTEAQIRQYRVFIDEMVRLVVNRYDGALKAEHGTGRNMAPFVETEWGEEGYRIMRELKALADPANLLNPDVIINPNPQAHITNLKDIPTVEPEVDKCIECGYCEPLCPPRKVSPCENLLSTFSCIAW